MTKLNRVTRHACIAAASLLFLATNASAETLVLECGAKGPDAFQLKIDLTNKTAISSYGDQVLRGHADPADMTITLHLQSTRPGQWDHTDGKLDRVTGVYSVRFCDRSECTGAYSYDCHRASRQF